MTAPDYPLLALGGYETYQLAHIATYIAERLARHRQSGGGREGRAARAGAVRDLAGAAAALRGTTESSLRDEDLPRPLDRDTFAVARDLLTTGPRSADVVALAGADQQGFAVIGTVPGLGEIGARVPTQLMAEAVRAHFLTQPVSELTAWAVTRDPQRVPNLPRRVDLAAFVEQLDPTRDADRAVARNLRGRDRRTDAAVRGRFARVDLDAPFLVVPGAAADPVRRRPVRTAGVQRPGGARRTGLRAPARDRVSAQNTAAPTVPSSSAGP